MIPTRRRRFDAATLGWALAAATLPACGAAIVAPSDPPSGVAVLVRPEAPRVEPRGTVGFEATVTSGPNTAVVWSVREAAGGSIDATGRYMAPSSLGVYHVVATSSADPSASGIATVTVASGFRISGTVTPASAGTGATLTLSGGTSATATADAGGNYSFAGLAGGSYAVTPAKAGFTFTPASQQVTVSGADVTGVNFTAAAFAPNLTVDASRTFQAIDGMGTNINVESWKNGELAPALDLLADVNGASLLRVARDPMDWVSSESDIQPLHDKDPATLVRIYESVRMKDLWSTIAYLNQKGLGGSQLVVNFMGWTPTWMGGSGAYGSPSYITAGKESAFATMIASLVYYGRAVKGLDFSNVAPMNEPDWDAKEGPSVGPAQYTTVLAALASELDWYGLNDVRIVGPDTASSPAAYVASMTGNSTVSGRVDHLAFHTYSGATSPGTSYAGKNYWLTETAVWCSTCDQNGSPPGGEWAFARDTGTVLLQDLANGLPAVLVWEGYDSFWYHHNSYSTWGLLAYDRATGSYTPRKRFYVNSQLTRFIRPGMRRTSVSSTIGNLTALAFYGAAADKVAIVGRNGGSSPLTVNGQLVGVGAGVTSLAVYQTDSGSRNLQRGADVPVVGNAFSVTISADTFFSLSN